MSLAVGEVLEALRALRPAFEARDIAHVGVFGSVARGKAVGGSDIDEVATPGWGRRPDLFDLGALYEILIERFEGCAIDLVVEPINNAQLAQAVAADRMDAF